MLSGRVGWLRAAAWLRPTGPLWGSHHETDALGRPPAGRRNGQVEEAVLRSYMLEGVNVELLVPADYTHGATRRLVGNLDKPRAGNDVERGGRSEGMGSGGSFPQGKYRVLLERHRVLIPVKAGVKPVQSSAPVEVEIRGFVVVVGDESDAASTPTQSKNLKVEGTFWKRWTP
ncbi:hypothetical protein DL769_000483 [Monosporascus sp. CRB-8-3]|nr:hypothetical protein DL769_000483 [Monosporascus sp. CRB-8-3]